MTAQDDASELVAQVEQALRARGISARLELRGTSLVLKGGESLDVTGTLQQWSSLPEDLRQKRCKELSALLSESRSRPRSAPRRPRSFSLPSALAPLLILGLLGGGVWLAFQHLAPGARVTGPSPSASANAAAELERGRAARRSNACAAARTRAVQGASLGPTDVEGWVVELVLLRPDSEPLPHALQGFIEPASGERAARVSWPGAPQLAKIDRFDAGVELSDARLAAGNVALRGLRLDFYGPYVAPYFAEGSHAEYLALADALGEQLRASYGALFAHCEGELAPHLGSWFRGPSAGDALSALLYFTGALGYTPNLDGAGSEGPGSLSLIRKAVGNVDRASAATEIASFRGLVAGRANAPVSITFPFREGDLATRAALGVARNHHLRD